MTLQDLIEKLRRFPIPSACGAVVIICFFAFYLRMDLLTDLEIENDTVQRDLQLVEQNMTHGRTLAADNAAMAERVAAIDARIIKPEELATNLKYFYEIEAITRVTISDLRQSSTAPTKDSSSTVFHPVDYSVMVNGRFDQVIAYIDELERGPHFYRLQGFTLQRGRSDSRPGEATSVSMALNLQLLGWP